MNTEELLKKRWKNTDSLLKLFKKTVRDLTKELNNEILDTFDSVDVALTDLNKPISQRERSRLRRLGKQWKEAGLKNKFLDYRLSTVNRKTTYADFIMILLLGIYAMYMKEVYDSSKKTFKSVAKDAQKQAEEEMGRKPLFPFLLTWAFIESLLIVRSLQTSLSDYLGLLVEQFAEKIYKLFVQSKQSPDNVGINEAALDMILQQQENQLINVNGDKESGVFTDAARQVWNASYIEPYKSENVQVRFIAEMDNVTTKMCRGMDNMLFYTNDWNRYVRWSDYDKRDIMYTTFGLVAGENLPPIDNHFHWCRSTITYQIDMPVEKLKTPVLLESEQYAINKWISSDFYIINDSLRRGDELSKEEQGLLEELKFALYKQPKYKGKIYRDLEIRNIDEFLNGKSVGDIFSEKQILSFSTSEGYNEFANVTLTVDSRSARDLRRYNPNENEVVYLIGQSFKVLNHKIKGSKHIIDLMEW